MKYLLLNKNKQAISNNGEIACENLKDEILQITNTNKIDVKNYEKVQVYDPNLKPENIPLGKTILGIPGNAEDNSTELINGNISNITNNTNKIRERAFYKCSFLTEVNFPMCSYIGSSAFGDCSELKNVSFPMCSYIGSLAFDHCNLESVNFPMCNRICYEAFDNCVRLTEASFPMCSYIESWAFFFCYNLTSLYLNVSSVPILENTNAFSSTAMVGYHPFGYSSLGSIYVPASLYEEFCNATNWNVFASRIVSYF